MRGPNRPALGSSERTEALALHTKRIQEERAVNARKPFFVGQTVIVRWPGVDCGEIEYEVVVLSVIKSAQHGHCYTVPACGTLAKTKKTMTVVAARVRLQSKI